MEYQCISKNQSTIGIIPIQYDAETLLLQLAHKEWYLPFIENMTEKRKCEWLSVRVLLKKLLGTEKEIRYNPLGKPYLSDHSSHIGISHTKGYAALIVDKKKEVAIDIETISPRIDRIRSRFLNGEEEIAISKVNERIHLLLHWTAKETIFKLLNTKKVDFKSHLHIYPFEPLINEWSNFESSETRTGKQNKYTVNYFVNENYVLTYI
jgi:4'-phosphopantetheinyl transferase EntD